MCLLTTSCLPSGNLFAGVIILVYMANKFRIHKLSKVDQFVMSYGGLRGAVAFALVLLIDPKVCQFNSLEKVNL
jgi:NhaP-type Na+/H+ or K+/H+ antiporter